MTLHERADKLLALREDLYEMHFHKVDREWLIEAMVDFALQLPQQETLYTEEQVRELARLVSELVEYDWHMNEFHGSGCKCTPPKYSTVGEIIQSLKQPKKD